MALLAAPRCAIPWCPLPPAISCTSHWASPQASSAPGKEPAAPSAHPPGSPGQIPARRAGGCSSHCDSGPLLIAASEDSEVPEPQPPAPQAAQPAALPEPATQQDGAGGCSGGSPARSQPAGPRAGGALLAQDQLQPPAPATGAAPEGAVAGPLQTADLPCQEELQQHFCKLTG